MSADPNKSKSIFLNAAERPAGDLRQAYLAEACGPDVGLRREVDELLAHHGQVGSFLEAPDVLPTLDAPPPAEASGTEIGPYKLHQQIGEGGMGTVFLARQTEPVKRLVALKVIKAGMDSRAVLARFEAERQALALMDHPNIAKVFDAGATPAGRPYFVMELVKGVPITRYCDDNRLTPRDRLALFVQVCQAVQHAHVKGVIHRDLKPSNVLVAPYDGRPVVKVIDFGVAKAAGQPLTERTLLTGFGAVIGTPEYMSPEQAELNNQDIDTRSDVYSLGVLLYEILTGTTPLTRKRIKESALADLLRLVREEEPPRPSTRLSATDELPSIAANRGMEPKKLSGLVRGELDWIVMKCLEKDRNRRYETANAFAADVQRYLDDEQVQACPPTAGYRLRKFARRNRAVLAAATVTALGVIVAVVALAVSNALIRQEQARTRDERDRAEGALTLADSRALEIRLGLERLQAANALLDRGRWYANERRWDDAHAAFTKAIALRPDHVSVWFERSNLYTRLGLWDLAAADYARQFELREPDTTGLWFQHALLRCYVGDLDGYGRVCGRMRERFNGTLNPFVAADVARTCVLARTTDADPDRPMGRVEISATSFHGHWFWQYLLGMVAYRGGQHESAVRRLKESLAGHPDWAGRAISYPILAMACHRLGKPAEARQALDEATRAIDQWTRERYQSRGDWVMHLGAEASWPIAWWDWLECQLYYREAKLLIDGSPPPDDARLHVLRARSLAGLRWSGKAAEEYDTALKLSPQDPQVRLEAHRNRGYWFAGHYQWGEAAAEFAKAGELQPNDSYLWYFAAVSHFAAGDVDAYRQICTAMLERFEKTQDPRTAGNVLQTCVLRADTLPDMARLLPLTRVADSVWHLSTWVRGAALYRAGRYEESVHCFETAAKTYRPRAWNWCFLALAHHRLGHADEARRCLAEAARWIEEANRHEGDDLSATQAAWGDWQEPVVFSLLLREAEAILGEKENKK